jgi:hypothetical protein
VFESHIDLVEISEFDLFGCRQVPGAQHAREEASEAVVGVVDGHRSYAIVPLLEEVYDSLVGLGVDS